MIDVGVAGVFFLGRSRVLGGCRVLSVGPGAPAGRRADGHRPGAAAPREVITPPRSRSFSQSSGVIGCRSGRRGRRPLRADPAPERERTFPT